MKLLKTGILNGIATVVKMFTMLIVNKLLAAYVGPSGYAVIGQFQNAVQIVTTFSSGTLNNGVIKYTAEYGNNTSKQQTLWKTAGSIALLSTILLSLVIILFRDKLATYFLHDSSLSNVFVWFAISLPLFVFNALLLAILNGKKEIRIYVIANIVGSIVMLISASIMTITWHLAGALIALATYQSFAFFITLYLASKQKWFKFYYLLGEIDKTTAINLGKFALMALVSAICVPTSQMIIRNHLIDMTSLQAAGYWDAMWRLSSAYLMLITTTLSVYFLPRFSEIKDNQELKKEIIQGYKYLLPLVIIFALCIYSCRELIITLLFTNKFLPMQSLFFWQLVGDCFKVASWILAFIMLAKAMTKLFIIIEIISSIMWIALSFICINYFGDTGVVIGYMINYIVYFFIIFLIFYSYLKKGK